MDSTIHNTGAGDVLAGKRFVADEGKYKDFIRQAGVFLSLVAICIFFACMSKFFLTQRNLISILLQGSIGIVVALGMTTVIITGGIDLSVGPMVALAGVIMGTQLKAGMNPAAAVLVSVGVGLCCGLMNGILITLFRLQAFLVTLGMLSIFRGLSLIYTGGKPVASLPQAYTRVVGGTVGVVPVPVILMAIIVLAMFLLFRFTKFGVYIFAIGGNENAAVLSGVNVKLYKILAYATSGILCGLAGAIMAGRLGAMEPMAGNGFELTAIAAAAIGGASLAGGKGSVIGTVLGALILSVLQNGLTLLNVQSFYQQLATGIVIIFAVLLDRFTNKED